MQSVNITSGHVEYPVATDGAVASWAPSELGDVGAATEFKSAEAVLKPEHNLGCQMVLSRRSMKQTGDALEAAVRRDMSSAIVAALDDAIINGTGANGQPLGIIPGAGTYGINVEASDVDSWATIRGEVVAFMEANAITDPAQVKIAFPPAVWGDLDNLISGLAISELDRMASHGVKPILSNQLPADTAILATTVNGVAPGFMGIWGGGVDLIRDQFTRAASGQLILTGIMTADFTVARGSQIRIIQDAG